MNEIAKREEPTNALTIPAELTVEQMVEQVKKIQHLMSSVMKEGDHYGVIPGTDKPSLLQPGAQKLNFVFRLGDQNTQITQVDLPNNHREYRVTLDIVHIPTGLVLSQGVGSCSTMETKYRYRNVADFDDTGLPIPADSKEHKQEYRKQGFGMKKINGVWCWVKYKDSARVENPDIADTYNTVLKMANKRAYIHGTIKATAASDLFTQDVEDFNKEEEHSGGKEPRAQSDLEEPFKKEDALFLRDMLLSYLEKVQDTVGRERAEKLRAALAKNEATGQWKRFADWITGAHEALKAEVEKQEALFKANAKPDTPKDEVQQTLDSLPWKKPAAQKELVDHD